MGALLLGREVGVGLLQVATHDSGEDGQKTADRKRNAPAPIPQLLGREQPLLQDEQHQDGAELSADQRDVLEARVEPPVFLAGDFAQIGGAGPIFPSEAEALGMRAAANTTGAMTPMLA